VSCSSPWHPPPTSGGPTKLPMPFPAHPSCFAFRRLERCVRRRLDQAGLGVDLFRLVPPARPHVGHRAQQQPLRVSPTIAAAAMSFPSSRSTARSRRERSIHQHAVDQGLWEPIRAELGVGDILIICFGTNDSANDPQRHTDPRGRFAPTSSASSAKRGPKVRPRFSPPRLHEGIGTTRERFIEPPSDYVVVTSRDRRA
jgi:hypothetical protein